MNYGICLFTAAAVLTAAPAVAGEPPVWTLEQSIERALATAPELRAAEAEVAVREGERRQAGAWPNPAIELRADEKLGLEDGSDGTDLRYAAVSQPLPITRLARQRRASEAQLAAAHDARRYQRLMLEQQVAETYHRLQLGAAHLALARERQAALDAMVSGPDRIARYLAPGERTRLGILREQAVQAIATAEGELSEEAAHLRTLLALPADVEPQPAALAPTAVPLPLDALLGRLESHPALTAAGHEQAAARAGVAAARAQRFADPVLSVFRERDTIGGAVRDYNGIGLSIQVPLWNLNSGGVARAEAEADMAGARRAIAQRDLDARLRKSHLHLNHLIGQAEDHRRGVLEPSERLFALTRRSFAAGEVNVLALVDAHDGYFTARARYLELLAGQWLEAADLRLAAGLPVVEAMEVTP